MKKKKKLQNNKAFTSFSSMLYIKYMILSKSSSRIIVNKNTGEIFLAHFKQIY